MISAEVFQPNKNTCIVLRLFFKSDDFAIFETCSVAAVQTSQGLYSGLASNVDFSIVALIVFGGNGSKVTWLFAKIGIPSKHMLPMVSRTSSHMFFFV